MNPLEPPDSTHLQAAQGWLDLGNHIEANDELEQITPQNRAHPDVLQVRWRVYAKAEKWEACLQIATALTKMTPDRQFGWLHRAHALRKLKRTSPHCSGRATWGGTRLWLMPKRRMEFGVRHTNLW